MQCDMCGTEGDLYRTEVEGTEMNLCRSCSSFGKKIGPAKGPETRNKKKGAGSERIEIVPRQQTKRTQELLDGYNGLIRKRRESLGLKQKELAVRMAEKESVIHKTESGSFKPGLKLARKFEKALGIKIIEEHVEKTNKRYKAKQESLTIGDLMSIRRRG